MSDAPDLTFIWDAWTYDQEIDRNKIPAYSSPLNKLSDIDFEMLRFFNLEPKGYGSPEIQPHAFRIEFPPKDVADYRLTFRNRRIQACGGAQGMFPGNMMPSITEIGCERCTPENRDTLTRFERGEVVGPFNDRYPLKNGFRMVIDPTMEVMQVGNIKSRTVLEESMLCTYLRPKVI
jgi:hypothetical protein